MSIVSLRWLLIVVLKSICAIRANWITGNLCWSMPCLNGGSCFGSAYTYLCICPVNYTGALCEKRLGVCQENPCSNRGLCVETSMISFECRCYFGYMGPTCGEQIPRNNSLIWSSLLPVHTRVLFDMLHDAYNTKLKGKSSPYIDNSQVDFLALLTTKEPALVGDLTTATGESVFTTASSETTDKEYVIKAEDIALEEIFSDLTTGDMNTNGSTDPSDLVTGNRETNMTSTVVVEENTAATTTDQLEQTLSNTTNDHEMVDIFEHSSSSIMSTALDVSTDTPDSTEATTTSFANDTEPAAQTTEVTSATITTTTMLEDNQTAVSSSTQPLPANTTADSQTINSRILYKLCQGILSRIFPNTSAVANDTTVLSLTSDFSPVNNYTTDTFLSWLQKYLTHSTSQIQTSTTESRRSSSPLQRVDMDDVLYQINDNNLEHEH